MGVLEDLKAQAHAARTQAEHERRSQEAVRAESARLVQPRVQAAYGYLCDLVRQLEVVPPEIVRAYDIRSFGRFDGLEQGEYRVYTADVRDRVERFTFQYACVRPGRRELRLETRAVATELRDYLANSGLRFTTREPGDRSTVFVVELRVPVTLEFTGDIAAQTVLLRTRNLGAIGASLHRLPPERVDPEFMDELARAVLGRTSRLRDLCGDVVPEDTREKIRAKVRERERLRARELRRGLGRFLSASADGESLGRMLGRTLLGRKPPR